MKKKFTVLLAFVMILVLACGCSNSGGGEEPASEGGEKVVTVAMPSAWSDLYPLGEVNYYDTVIFDQVYDSLVAQEPDGSYSGDLAESWDVNDESTEVTFHLADNVKWHDGEAFSAKDVETSFKMFADPDIKSSSRYYLRYIAGCDDSGVEESADSIKVEALDDNTVKFTLKSPTFIDTFLYDMSNVYILPDHIIKDYTAEDVNDANTWTKPMGTGAFIYADAVDGERMEFTANPDYFRGAPDMDKLVVRVVDSSAVLAGLMNGEIDAVMYGGVPLDDWAMAQEQDNLVCESNPSTGYQMLIINSQKDYLNEKVRQAINLAINRDALVDQLLQGEGESIVTPICSLSQYYNDKVKAEYDPEKAKELLAEANFPADQKLTFYVPTGNAVREKAAAMIVEDLKAVGIETEIVSQDFSAVMSALQNGDEDLGIVASGGSFDPSESLEMLTGAFNLCKFPEDNELQALLKEGNKKLTFEERQPIFAEFQEKVAEQVPYGYLFTTNNLVAYNNRLSNVNTKNFAQFNWQIHTWKVAD